MFGVKLCSQFGLPGKHKPASLLQQILGFEGNKYTQYISAKVVAFFKKYKIIKIIKINHMCQPQFEMSTF